MIFFIALASLCAVLFLAMLALMELGRRLGDRRISLDPEGAQRCLGSVESALFALLGLLMAFTFSGAASKFEDRRSLVVEEANAIGTAYLRLDVLPQEAQPSMRDLFRKYVDSRIATYRMVEDVPAAMASIKFSEALQKEIWAGAVEHGRVTGPVATLLLPSLNEMIDITTTRTMATRRHPPLAIFTLLAGLALGCSLLAGFAMSGAKARSALHMVLFAALVTITIYVIVDLEYPRLGLIRVDDFDQAMLDVRRGMD
jgi:hypothetical protein